MSKYNRLNCLKLGEDSSISVAVIAGVVKNLHSGKDDELRLRCWGLRILWGCYSWPISTSSIVQPWIHEDPCGEHSISMGYWGHQMCSQLVLAMVSPCHRLYLWYTWTECWEEESIGLWWSQQNQICKQQTVPNMLGVSFTSGGGVQAPQGLIRWGKMEYETVERLSASSAVMWALYWTIVGKRELGIWSGCVLHIFLWRSSGHIQQERDPGLDSGHTWGIKNFICPGNASGFIWRSWNALRGISKGMDYLA